MALQNLRSNTANKRPTASGMVDGQVAINTNATNPGLFFKDASDGIRKVGPVFIGSSAPNSSPATGGSTGHSIGEQWLDTSSSRYVVKTWDGTAWRDDDSNYLQLTGGALSGALTIDNAANVSALDLKFDGDTDTGFYAPAANTLGFVGGGTERVRINSSGDVGIGTTSPNSRLEVRTPSGTDCQIRINEAGTSNPFIIEQTATESRVQVKASQPLVLGAQDSSGSSQPIIFKTRNNERARIDNLGRVGIGTSSPSYPLDVNGNAQFGTGSAWRTDTNLFKSTATGGANIRSASGSASTPIYSAVGDEDTGAYFPEANAVAVSTAGTQRLLIDSLGRVGINTTACQADLDVNGTSSAAKIRIGASSANRSAITYNNTSSDSYLLIDVDEGNNSTANTHFKIWVDGSERLRIDSAGNVGIGTTSPSAKLHVAGPARVGANSTANAELQIGAGATGNRNAFIDLVGDTTYTDFGLRIIRNNGGANTSSVIDHRGTGTFEIKTREAAPLVLSTASNERLRLTSDGNVGIGTTSPSQALHVVTSGAGQIRIADGTRAAVLGSTGSICFAGSVTSGQGFALYTANSEQVRITSDGNVGIGLTNPGAFNAKAEKLVLANDGDHVGITLDCDTDKEGSIYFADGSTGDNLLRGQIVYNHSGDSLRFVTNASERLRINSSGNVGIGTTTPESRLEISRSTADDNTDLRIKNYRPGIRLVDISASAADGEIVVDGGSMRFRVSQETNASTALTERMRVTSEGRVGIGTTNPSNKFVVSNSNKNFEFNPGTTSTILSYDRGANAYLAMKTRALTHTWSSGSSDYLHINSSGQLGIGTTSPTKKLQVNGEAFVTGNTFFHSTNSSAILAGTAIGKYFQTDGNLISGKTTTNGNTHQAFCNPNGIVGTIRTSGSATQYNTSSDYRLKENVVDIADGITRVKQLQPRRFNFIADADTIVDGFIAHEAQAIVPEAVSGTHNEVDDDGNAVMQGIDQSKLVPLLTAALKEAIAKIETLETKVAALEAQ